MKTKGYLVLGDGTRLESSTASLVGSELILYMDDIPTFAEAYRIASDPKLVGRVEYHYDNLVNRYTNFTDLTCIQMPDKSVYRTDVMVKFRPVKDAKAELSIPESKA